MCDSPASSKLCKYNAHNGKYGCIKCMHPTIYISKTVYPTLETVNEFYKSENKRNKDKANYKIKEPLNEIVLRTNYMYREQTIEAERNEKVFLGVHGYAKVSDWISIPDQVYFEMMHLTDIGTWKWMFNSFFDPENKFEAFYLGEFNKKIYITFKYAMTEEANLTITNLIITHNP
jgi:hypothetical protein